MGVIFRKIGLLAIACVSSFVVWAHDVAIDGIFYNIDIANQTASVTYQGDDFLSVSDKYTANVVIPSFITYNNQQYTVTAIGDYAFAYCATLLEVVLPNQITAIGHNAFVGCTALAAVEIPQQVKTIGEWAFAYCTALTTLTIPNGVTAIAPTTFYACRGLKNITLGSGIESVGEYAFVDCQNLQEITIKAVQVPTTGTSVFTTFDATLYVPCQAVANYTNSDVFGKFTEIKCIPEGPTTSLVETVSNSVYVLGKTIYGAENLTIYNMLGRNVTHLNGSLRNGIYAVQVGNSLQKVLVK